jgi:DNA-directed RNA polymerase subunit RPC12/RpoP
MSKFYTEGENMSKIYEPCPYCMQEILVKPILERHQGRLSILCPYCLSHRSEWANTIEDVISSWNNYSREEEKNLLLNTIAN